LRSYQFAFPHTNGSGTNKNFPQQSLYIGSGFVQLYPDEIADISVDNEFTSDHLTVSFELLTKVKRLRKIRRTVYNLKNADLPGLMSALTRIPCDTAIVDKDVDSSIACWYNMFTTCIDEFIPNIIIKDGNRPPWIDREVLQLIRKKKRIRRKAKSNDSPIIWERFRKLRQELKNCLNLKSVYIILVYIHTGQA
jgi:hypothetical protein